jgi:hypothetical protein
MNAQKQTLHPTMVGCNYVGRWLKTDLRGKYETVIRLGVDTFSIFSFHLHHSNGEFQPVCIPDGLGMEGI